MKKVFIIICWLATSLIGFSQSCEEREDKLLESMGTFSAGMLYNTYSFIGSILEGYSNNIKTAATVNDLLGVQKSLIDLSIKVLEKLEKENIMKNQSDKDYVNTAIQIFKGLNTQAQLLLDYTTDKSKEKLEVYDEQRKQNWSAISNVLGLK